MLPAFLAPLPSTEGRTETNPDEVSAMTKVAPLAFAILFAAGGLARAEEPKAIPETVSYYKDVRPVFVVHCQGCHQPAKPLGGYVMTSHAELLKKGDSGKFGVVASDVAKSHLFEQITPQDGKPAAMPKNKPPLAARDVEVIKKWIAQGAKDDTPAS